jgi:hypothetical protein
MKPKKELVHVPEVFIRPIAEINKYVEEIRKHKLIYSKVELEQTRFATLIYFYNENATKYLCFRVERI